MPALLTAQTCDDHIHLVIGTGALAASRCIKSVEAGAKPILISPPADDLHYTLSTLIDGGRLRCLRRDFEEEDLKTLGREEVGGYVDAVFVTYGPRHPLSSKLSHMCKRQRIPVNVVDAPQLCTFTLLSTYSDGPLHIGITTSGRGCKLAARIRREIASILPNNLGASIERLGMMRRRIWEEDQLHKPLVDPASVELDLEDEEAVNQKHTFNTFISVSNADPEIARMRRMRWLSQICEYWPLSKLANITDGDIANVLEAYRSVNRSSLALEPDISLSATQRGSISLAGSGPGHPSLLTLATQTCIQNADYILADKLVPAEILALIPRRTPVHIARKFPGNADAAQEELLTLALAAMREGKHVLRLKQGDPYLYGRGAEEVHFFRNHGYEPKVIPGVTSALSAPLFAGIPVTHRSVADTVVVCTGTGRKGVAVVPPQYQKSKTVVFLMALHRLTSLIESLVDGGSTDDTSKSESQAPGIGMARSPWPRDTPCAVIERASCPDQRVIRSTLEHVCQAVEEEGSRPPGLLVVGWACNVLHELKSGQRWSVQEGFKGLDGLGSTNGLDVLRSVEHLSAKETVPDSSAAGLQIYPDLPSMPRNAAEAVTT